MARTATAQIQNVHRLAVELARFVKSYHKDHEDSELLPTQRPLVPFTFTPELNYATILTKTLPLLRAYMVHVPVPDWEQGTSIIHRYIGSLNGLEHSSEALLSTMRNFSRKIDSLPDQNAMTTQFANNIDATIAKVAQANNKFADLSSRLQWRRVRVVTFYCRHCEKEQRSDWTEMAGHWDHPPGWETTSFGQATGGWMENPFELGLEAMFEDRDRSDDKISEDEVSEDEVSEDGSGNWSPGEFGG